MKNKRRLDFIYILLTWICYCCNLSESFSQCCQSEACEIPQGQVVTPHEKINIEVRMVYYYTNNPHTKIYMESLPNNMLIVNWEDLSKIVFKADIDYHGSKHADHNIKMVGVNNNFIDQKLNQDVITAEGVPNCGLYKVVGHGHSTSWGYHLRCTADAFVCVKKPNPTFTAIKVTQSMILQGSSVKLTTNGAQNVIWTVNGVETTAKSITVTPAQSTTYTVRDINDAGLCEGSGRGGQIRVVDEETFYGCTPNYISEVLSASSTRFSDIVPVDFAGSNTDGFYSNNPYDNGTKGIWRPEESFVYVEGRNQDVSKEVKTWEDGTFNFLPKFNYDKASWPICFPKWRKVNEITKYNTNNNEVENKDILNNYSSALYGFNNTIATAVASNARTNEIAFESFEEYDVNAPLSVKNRGGGNLSIFNTNAERQDYTSRSKEFQIISAKYNNIVIVAKPSSFVIGSSVYIQGAPIDKFSEKSIFGTGKILTVSQSEIYPDQCNITIDDKGINYSAAWVGKLRTIETFSANNLPSMDMGQAMVKIVKGISHSGNQSLSIDGNAAYQQEKLDLIPGKRYLISAWVKSNSSDEKTSLSYKSASGSANDAVALKISLVKKIPLLGSVPIEYKFEPSGNVIEGWQKIEGEFDAPTNMSLVSLHIQGGLTNVCPSLYIDDIRIQPVNSNMKSYVYDRNDLKLRAILDENNFATFYHYDPSGKLYLLEKETERGVMTVQESLQYQPEK